ncbi:uncharacterized protein LOC127847094 [Dreissena polymorpha]|uniref:uncharacterized protein LOC127847094 n=1 Tax=Dreissena polymorpha TaxID=45954 RepID=UPI0022644FF8|nr:uncharacterized protein LOC127847094 [Dreissena polymorpha]
MSNTEIACTLPNDRTVQVIHVGKTMTVSKSFKLDVECYGICYHDNAFYITSGWSTDKEVQIMDTEGVVQQKLRPEKGILRCPLYVTVDGKLDHIYVSDYETGIVGMDMLGKVTFKFSDTETKGFMGICSSPQGEVFICTLQPNGISRVQTETNRVYGSITTLNEPELEPVISLPTFNKGGQRPRSIAFSRKSQKILVSYVGQSVDMMNIYHF